jgi:hypothetical protein
MPKPTTTQSPSETIEERQECLREAERLVTSDRNKQYGEPVDNMARTAEMFAAYLGNRNGRELEATDIAMFGIILKIGRLANDPTKLDSWIDLCGYASIGYECAKKAAITGDLEKILNAALQD